MECPDTAGKLHPDIPRITPCPADASGAVLSQVFAYVSPMCRRCRSARGCSACCRGWTCRIPAAWRPCACCRRSAARRSGCAPSPPSQAWVFSCRASTFRLLSHRIPVPLMLRAVMTGRVSSGYGRLNRTARRPSRGVSQG